MTSELEDQIEAWFHPPPAPAPRHTVRLFVVGATVATALAAGAVIYEHTRASPRLPQQTVQPVMVLDPLYVSAPREPRELISAQK